MMITLPDLKVVLSSVLGWVHKSRPSLLVKDVHEGEVGLLRLEEIHQEADGAGHALVQAVRTIWCPGARSLETVAGIDVDGIEVRLLLEELPHGVDGARISADALLSIIAGAAGGVRGFEPADNRNRSRD